MERNEGESGMECDMGYYQLHDVGKGFNAVARIRGRSGEDLEGSQPEDARVTSGRGGGIRKCLHPRFDTEFCPEIDLEEKLSPGAWDPRFGYQAACLERSLFIAQMIDDEIENVWWEDWGERGRHRYRRGFSPRQFDAGSAQLLCPDFPTHSSLHHQAAVRLSRPRDKHVLFGGIINPNLLVAF